jgi:GDP-4-dehydro-6-deoxy-D-mannose reductase
LADQLIQLGHEVFGTTRDSSSLKNIRHIKDSIHLLSLHINNIASVEHVLRRAQPDRIFFLISARVIDGPELLNKVNVNGTINFFEELIRFGIKPRIVLISSSAVYGIQDVDCPIDEDARLLPVNHYGMAKMFQEEVAKYYCRVYGLDVIIGRPFNHPGPRENIGLVCSDFATQIAEIERGIQEPIIKVGNLKCERDFTDVRDVVKGYVLLADRGVTGEIYNLCSGKSISAKSILDMLISMSSSNITVKTDTSRIRTSEVSVQVGDNS